MNLSDLPPKPKVGDITKAIFKGKKCRGKVMTISGELKILSVHFKNLDKFRYIYVLIYNKILHGYPRSQIKLFGMTLSSKNFLERSSLHEGSAGDLFHKK